MSKIAKTLTLTLSALLLVSFALGQSVTINEVGDPYDMPNTWRDSYV